MREKNWICTGAFTTEGETYTIWIKPMYKFKDYTQHFECKVVKNTPIEAKNSLKTCGFDYTSNFNKFEDE